MLEGRVQESGASGDHVGVGAALFVWGAVRRIGAADRAKAARPILGNRPGEPRQHGSMTR